MTCAANLPYPFSSVFIRGEIAFSEKQSQIEVNLTQENYQVHPALPPGGKTVFAIRTQQPAENNTQRPSPYPANPICRLQ